MLIVHTTTHLITDLLAGAISPAIAETFAGSITITAGGISDVCAKAPEGVAPYVADVLGRVKYGVIAIIIGCGFASTGALIIGKLGTMGRASQIGASGLFWTVVGAVAFVVIYGVLNGIIGQGC